MAIGFQILNFAALSVVSVLQYSFLPLALRNVLSESLYKAARRARIINCRQKQVDERVQSTVRLFRQNIYVIEIIGNIFGIIIKNTEQSVSGGKIPSGILTSSEKVTGRVVVLVEYYQCKQYQQRVEREFQQRQRQQRQ